MLPILSFNLSESDAVNHNSTNTIINSTFKNNTLDYFPNLVYKMKLLFFSHFLQYTCLKIHVR